MEAEILQSLLKRPGMEGKEELLKDMIRDSLLDVRGFLNYPDSEEIPEGCIPAVKELSLIRFSRDGAEGLQSEAQSSGGSTTYLDGLPERIKRTIRRYRRLPR